MTIHEYMAEMALERFEGDADGLGVLLMARRGLREDHWHGEYLSAIGQYLNISPPSWPLEQIAAFIEVHTMILGGSVAELLVTVGAGPCSPVGGTGAR